MIYQELHSMEEEPAAMSFAVTDETIKRFMIVFSIISADKVLRYMASMAGMALEITIMEDALADIQNLQELTAAT